MIPKRYTLRSAFVAVAIGSVLLAIWCHRSLEQARAVAAIEAVGGRVRYTNDSQDQSFAVPRWLVEFLGRDYFYDVQGVTLYPTDRMPADEMLTRLPQLSSLTDLSIWPAAYKTKPVPKKVPGGLDDSGAMFIVNELNWLQHLSLLGAKLSDESVFALLDLPDLESVQISRHADFGGDEPIGLYYTGDQPVIDVRITRAPSKVQQSFDKAKH